MLTQHNMVYTYQVNYCNEESLLFCKNMTTQRERENTKLVTYKGLIIIHVSFITSCILKLNIPDRKLT